MAADVLFDEIYLHEEPTQRTRKPVLLFYIPGNPGLIEYYREYLSFLYDILIKQHPSLDIHIYGASLQGFEVTGTKEDDAVPHDGPFILKDQVAHLTTRLHRIATKISSHSKSPNANEPLRTIIAGHSVGAWLALELTYQHLSRSSSITSTMPLEIKSAIALFPTVYDLALSPRGRIAAPLLDVPGLIFFLHLVAALLTLLPTPLLQLLVGKCAGMPARGARVTTAFLCSRAGVYQALHLAKDEFAVIKSETESSWSEELWSGGGVRVEQLSRRRPGPALFFYWGGSDGYVAPATMARVSASRGNRDGAEGKAIMVVDDQGTNHAFCVAAKGNRLVADRTAEFLKCVLGAI